ncbi:hypothetical protein L7G72_19170 [Xenorhabdus bovienii]|uniref:hypothetical protein n=1 Tax=Xenorhabdus bovienii TaxID=40576 RepID=UPI001EDFDF3B|nr:hypothetical protein [Xenorhabdus bovienii]MCG3463891.1 hypothetical protein [Xenorhabdus bovienii]
MLSKSRLNLDKGIILSVPDGSDIVIGQDFFLDIILIYDSYLPNSVDVRFSNLNGLLVNHISKPLFSSGSNSVSITAFVTIDKYIHLDKYVSYTIFATGFSAQNIRYNAKEINEFTIQLEPNKSFCIAPESVNNPNDNDAQYITYYALLKDSTNQPMKNTPIQVLSYLGEDFSKKVKITTDDQFHDAINYISHNNKYYITVYSDETGKVSFRAYPIKNTSAILELASTIFGIDHSYQAGILYIMSPQPRSMFEYLPDPSINGANNAILKPIGDDKVFDVIIECYDNLLNTDRILFFISENPEDLNFSSRKLIFPARNIGDISNQHYTFSLPYDIFPVNKKSSLSYVVAPVSGNYQYSLDAKIKYIGGSVNIPSDNVNRVYNKPVVYSSFANINTAPPLVNSENNILSEGDFINRATISNYVNNNYDAIYIKIEGVNDKNHKQLPVWGNEVYLNVYVRSSTVNYLNSCEHSRSKSCHYAVISSNPDNYIINDKLVGISTTVIPIKQKELAGIASYIDGTAGWIYFEYYVVNNITSEKTYSHYWEGKIDTAISGDG